MADPRFDITGLNPNADFYNNAWTYTQKQLSNYGDIANQGIFGPEGIRQITRGDQISDSVRRMRLAKAIRQNLARRLGPRAGGAADIAYNEALSQDFLNQGQARRNLTAENYRSKLYGLQGRDQALERFANIYFQNEQLQGLEPGVLDYIQTAGQIAGPIAAAF